MLSFLRVVAGERDSFEEITRYILDDGIDHLQCEIVAMKIIYTATSKIFVSQSSMSIRLSHLLQT